MADKKTTSASEIQETKNTRSHSTTIQFGGRERLLSTIYRIENAVRDFLDNNRDRLIAVVTSHLAVSTNGQVIVEGYPELAEDVAAFQQYSNQILFIPFTRLDQYLHSLETICEVVKSCGARALIYLAAAVSDFYINEEKLPTHKIQSKDVNGELQLTLSIAPKVIDRLVNKIVTKAYIVSFKLETDEEILVKKAMSALKKYGHQAVIGNCLATRKRHVVFVYPNGNLRHINLTDEDYYEGVEIESQIVDELYNNHLVFIEKSRGDSP